VAGITSGGLAPTGSTGNNTHAGLRLTPVDNMMIGIEFVVEVAGATPTITWKVQGTLAEPTVADASAGWEDIPYVLSSTATESQAARTAKAAGSQFQWLALSNIRFYKRLRLVTTANTNITYRAAYSQLIGV
jgi:hypothetical protein